MTTRLPSGGFIPGALPSVVMIGGGVMGPMAPGAASPPRSPCEGPAGRDSGSTPQAESNANPPTAPNKVLRCKLDMMGPSFECAALDLAILKSAHEPIS